MDTDQALDSRTARLLAVVAQAALGPELRARLLSFSRGRRLAACLPAPADANSGLAYVAGDVDRGIQGRSGERIELTPGRPRMLFYERDL
jgi:hypothetical protein